MCNANGVSCQGARNPPCPAGGAHGRLTPAPSVQAKGPYTQLAKSISFSRGTLTILSLWGGNNHTEWDTKYGFRVTGKGRHSSVLYSKCQQTRHRQAGEVLVPQNMPSPTASSSGLGFQFGALRAPQISLFLHPICRERPGSACVPQDPDHSATSLTQLHRKVSVSTSPPPPASCRQHG